jgi:hypothetical protein
MNRAVEANLVMIRYVATRLGRQRERVVFLGGVTTALLIKDDAASDVRVTVDVDVIVEIASRGDYYRLAESLRIAGFSEDTREGAPVCRWLVERIAVDVMTTDAGILGFSNQWYQQALQHAEVRQISDDMAIRLVTAPYFLANR